MIKNIRHRSSFKREREEGRNVIGRQAGSAVDDGTVAPSGTAVFLGGGSTPREASEGGGEPDPQKPRERREKKPTTSIFSGKSSLTTIFLDKKIKKNLMKNFKK